MKRKIITRADPRGHASIDAIDVEPAVSESSSKRKKPLNKHHIIIEEADPPNIAAVANHRHLMPARLDISKLSKMLSKIA